MTERIEQEVALVLDSIDSLAVAWTEIGRHQQSGSTTQMMYSDIVEFANLRLETASTIALLVRDDRIADALGLCRSLLEHALLLRLMTKGNQYFELGPEVPNRSHAEFKKVLTEKRTELAELHARGEATHCLRVERYPRGRDRLMWVYEGLKSADEPDFFVPVHYFHYNEFRPEVMRLDDKDYFDPVPSAYRQETGGRSKAMQKHKDEAGFRYRFFLSYDALLVCLGINDLASAEEIKRIDAHYTFLGQFLHPTNRAARQLHLNSNNHIGGFRIGIAQNYDSTARLLAALYALHLTAMVVGEISDMLEGAPSRYLADPGTSEVRKLLQAVTGRFDYFWFVFNDAPLYDRWIFGVNEASDEELIAAGGFAGLATDKIKFDSGILEHLRHALTSWGNSRVGPYMPPFGNA